MEDDRSSTGFDDGGPQLLEFRPGPHGQSVLRRHHLAEAPPLDFHPAQIRNAPGGLELLHDLGNLGLWAEQAVLQCQRSRRGHSAVEDVEGLVVRIGGRPSARVQGAEDVGLTGRCLQAGQVLGELLHALLRGLVLLGGVVDVQLVELRQRSSWIPVRRHERHGHVPLEPIL